MKYPVIYFHPWVWDYTQYEVATSNYYKSNIKEGWTVFDCGARDGYFTMLFAELVGYTGRVHSFEPTETFDTLHKNLTHYNLTNTRINKVGIGKQTGIITESVYRNWGADPIVTAYKFTTIDDYIISNGIKSVNLIKADIDSFEYDMVQGMKYTLEHIKPLLVIELNEALGKRDSSRDQVMKFLEGHFYKHINTFEENYLFQFVNPP